MTALRIPSLRSVPDFAALIGAKSSTAHLHTFVGKMDLVVSALFSFCILGEQQVFPITCVERSFGLTRREMGRLLPGSNASREQVNLSLST